MIECEPRRLEKKYDVNYIIELIASGRDKKSKSILDGNPIKISTLRLKTFQTKGIHCIKCGKVGQYFVLERSQPGSYHLQLYTIGDCGEEILMTHDHIIPRSKDGLDMLSNVQTMCLPCNEEKGSGD